MLQSKTDTKPVEFGLHSIRITNVGAIDEVTLTIENKSLLALYAGNGTGKTTLLECISLLGHLPCFPYVERGQAPKASRLQQLLHPQKAFTFTDYKGQLKLDDLNVKGLDGWLNTIRPMAGASFGLIEFSIFDTNAKHRFAIVIHSPGFSNDALQLTSILSRSEFDNVSHGQHEFNDDLLLSQCGFIVYEKSHQQGQLFETLLNKIVAGRTFLIGETRDNVRVPTLHAFDTGASPRSVTYINTDLNDFGRGNDLRESPKDLLKDFGLEMHQRMRIELEDDGSFTHLKELNRIVNGLISVPVSHFKHPDVIPPSFKITTLTVEDGRPQIVVDRKDGSDPLPLGFMSAGENEVFFVFLMLLNFCHNPAVGKSIILLDEPDLHIANSSRSGYFREILGLTQGRAQLILSTHSPALFENIITTYKDTQKAVKVLFRRITPKEDKKSKLTIEYDGLYLSKLRITRETVRSPVQLLANRLRFLYNYQASRVSSIVPLDTFGAALSVSGWLIASVIFGFFLLGAVANDALNTADAPAWIKPFFWNATDRQYHEKTRFFLLGAMGAFVAPILAVQVMRDKRNKEHSNLVKRFKDPEEHTHPQRGGGLLSVFISFIVTFIPVFVWRGDFLTAGAVATAFAFLMWLIRRVLPLTP